MFDVYIQTRVAPRARNASYSARWLPRQHELANGLSCIRLMTGARIVRRPSALAALACWIVVVLMVASPGQFAAAVDTAARHVFQSAALDGSSTHSRYIRSSKRGVAVASARQAAMHPAAHWL